jgi:hypothetical protein
MLTPRSELASNISPSAVFRYIEEVHRTLLIDEAVATWQRQRPDAGIRGEEGSWWPAQFVPWLESAPGIELSNRDPRWPVSFL